MKPIKKIATALRLILRGDFTSFRRQIRINLAPLRFRRAAGRAFVYHDFGFPMVCHPAWPDSAACLSGGDYDEWETRLMRRWLVPGDSAFDFGANIGVYAYACAAGVGASGRIIAVDADAFVIANLQAGARLLGTSQLHAVHRAMAAESGQVTFYVRADHADTGGQSLRPGENELAGSTAVTVPASTLPHLLAELGYCDVPALVKIDIEGAEAMLFATVPSEWLAATGPLWIVEINPSALAKFGGRPADLIERLPEACFERWLLTKHPVDPAMKPQLRRLTPGESFTDAHYYNLVAIPRGPSNAGRVARIRRFIKTRA